MDAKAWLLKKIREIPPDGGFISFDNHPNEKEFIELSKRIITDYNDIFREDGFEIELSNDYKSVIKRLYPF